jgi:UDP-N-acetylglucosamine--N-acetylmuramyl-(pentapeptide) pyrophosphoryl-undecaprenol N-acetylglucosamine transferase
MPRRRGRWRVPERLRFRPRLGASAPPRYAFFGGGTGGHLAPGLAVAGALTEGDAAEAVFFTGRRAGERSFTRPDGIRMCRVPLAQPRGLRLRFAAELAVRAGTMLRVVHALRPDACLGLGGYVSLPGIAAALLAGARVVVLEQNAVAGRVNRLLAPFVECVCTAFPETAGLSRARRVVWTGTPVREEFVRLRPPTPVRPERARTTIAVLGGSQGARALNEAMLAALPQLAALRMPLRIVHAAGPDADEVARGYARWGIAAETAAFFPDIAERIRDADLAVARAGGSTLAELAVLGIPAVLVPYPYAQDGHQAANAAWAARQGAAAAYDQRAFGPEVVVAAVRSLATDARTWAARARRAWEIGRPDAARAVARVARGEKVSGESQ